MMDISEASKAVLTSAPTFGNIFFEVKLSVFLCNIGR